MLMRYLIFCSVFMLMSANTLAQSSKKKKKIESSTSQPVIGQPSSIDPNYPRAENAPKQSKKVSKSAGPTYDNERKYYQRLEQLEKTRRENEKMMDKPQYSDPMYFGHKRPPKKRPAHKMKFCKECGIRH